MDSIRNNPGKVKTSEKLKRRERTFGHSLTMKWAWSSSRLRSFPLQDSWLLYLERNFKTNCMQWHWWSPFTDLKGRILLASLQTNHVCAGTICKTGHYLRKNSYPSEGETLTVCLQLCGMERWDLPAPPPLKCKTRHAADLLDIQLNIRKWLVSITWLGAHSKRENIDLLLEYSVQIQACGLLLASWSPICGFQSEHLVVQFSELTWI